MRRGSGVGIHRDFPFGLSLEPIQVKNAAHFNHPPRRSNQCRFRQGQPPQEVAQAQKKVPDTFYSLRRRKRFLIRMALPAIFVTFGRSTICTLSECENFSSG